MRDNLYIKAANDEKLNAKNSERPQNQLGIIKKQNKIMEKLRIKRNVVEITNHGATSAATKTILPVIGESQYNAKTLGKYTFRK
jgi:hypothetical protein